MAYWFDDYTEDELIATALLLGCEFMTDEQRITYPEYGPYHRFREAHEVNQNTISWWSTGYSSKGVAARQFLRHLERQKTLEPKKIA